jgi:hypothetical protein
VGRRSARLVVGTRAAASIPLGAVSHLLAVEVQPRVDAGERGTVVGIDDAHLLDSP